MKAWRFLLMTVMFVASFSLASRSVENRAVRNPAGYSTIPPSSYRSGLVSTPNPIDPTGNLLMTGNVRRGMHFRGWVPYRSTTSFNATLGSSALNSFLRDTAGSEDFGGLANKYRVQPFYSPTQTVTTMVPGRSEVFGPMSMRIDDRVRQRTSFVANGLLGLDSSLRGHTSLGQDATAGDSNLQEHQSRYPSAPLRVSFDSAQDQGTSYRAESSHERRRGSRQVDQSLVFAQDDELAEPLVPGQLGIREARDGSTERSALLTDDVSREPSRKGNLPAPPRRRPAKDDLTRYPGEEVRQENLKARREMFNPDGSVDAKRSVVEPIGLGAPDQVTPPTSVETPGSESQVPSLESDDRREILEQIRQQLDALAQSVEASLEEDAGGIGRSESSLQHREFLSVSQDALTLSDTLHLYESPRVDSRLSPAGGSQADTSLKSQEGIGEVGILSTVSSLDELRQDGTPGLSDNAEQIKGSHDSLESFSQSRFNQHLSAARDHLKAGRYYRSVDSFTLATVYQPNNPVVLAGKGHALFAAGEYMSSALFLARALAVQPGYMQSKVDLTAMLGGAEKLSERIADVEQWLARSGSAQLQFLLGYVYFRTDRLNQAKQAIAEAYETMPQSQAIVALRMAINQATR